MGWVLCVIPFFLFFLNPCSTNSSPILCHPHDHSSLLSLINSFHYNTDFGSWNIYKDCCDWSGVSCDSVTGHVVGLQLSGLEGTIDSNSSLFSLTHLLSLDLSFNDFKGSSISPNFGRFPSLLDLDLSYSNFCGHIPLELAYLSNLLQLQIDSGQYYELRAETSSMKQLFANLTCLTLVSLRYVNMFDVLPDSFMNLSTSLMSLYFDNAQLKGRFPEHIFRLANLSSFSLSHNKLEGQLPYLCSNSSSTPKHFLCDSSNHQLLGPLPLSLLSLRLRNNLLSGTIPTWLYSLPNLEYIELNVNLLSGTIPTLLYSLPNLRVLDLGVNNLSGVVILDHFLELRTLYYLDFSFNSLLSVISIPHANSTVLKSNNLWYLGLSSCNISQFPNGLKSLEGLQHLDLSLNKIEGSIPEWLWNLAKASKSSLNLSHNKLTHTIQIPPLNNSFSYIDLQSNRLQGHLPKLPLTTLAFFASNNQLKGRIPSMICNINFLEVLDLSYNSFDGNILPCLGNFSNSLSVLDLKMNMFHGIVPLAFSSSLRTLNLNGNRFEGPLPQSLLNSKSLEVLDVGNNELNGYFPQFLESLPELRVLILRSNKFHGAIKNPKISRPFQNLRIMDISNNKFTGVLPTIYFENFKAIIGAHANELEYLEEYRDNCYYGDAVMVSMKGISIELVRIQTLFTTIDFSKNEFTGGIPKTIGKLDSLKGLNFSHNNLVGTIPPSLGDLSNLEWLDLSYNKLVGTIPQQLASNLSQLNFLNLAENNLTGKIPQGTQFNTFSNNSYDENSGLCGFPLTKQCSDEDDNIEEVDNGDDEQNIYEKLTWKLSAMIGYGAGLGIGVSIGYTLFFIRRFDFWLQKRIATRR